MNNNTKKLFLLDAYALLYRAFFALNKNPRINSKGLNTSAIMGFLNTLYEILKKQKPTHIGVAFDKGAPCERCDVFSQYKANRESMPDDLRASVPYVMELIRAFNIPIFAVEGYEADDVIGTLSRKAEAEGFITYMMTPDKDFGQLVTDNVLIYKPAKFGEDAVVMGTKEVCEKYGIARPEQLIDILGLWGDAVDNIPGIPGVGEKTASKLIAEYGSMENLIQHAEQLKGKLRENVIQYAEQGLMSKGLATINTNVPVDFNADELMLSQPDITKLTQLLDELELRNFLKRFTEDLKNQGTTVPQTTTSSQPDLFSSLENNAAELTSFSEPRSSVAEKHDYKLVQTEDEIKIMIATLSKNNRFAFNTITTNIDPYQSDIVGISFSCCAHEAWYVSLPTDYDACVRQLNLMQDLLADKNIEKIGQNLKHDISVLRHYHLTVEGPLFDTMIAHYLIEPEQGHNIEYLADVYLNYKTMSSEDLIGRGKQHRSMREVAIDKMVDYAAENADIAFRLYEKLLPLLLEHKAEKLFREVEMPLVPVLSAMEGYGVKIDIDNLHQISNDFGKQISTIENTIYSLAGTNFNINSPKQLGDILFDKLQIKTSVKKTKTGQYATGEDVLAKIIHEHPIVQLILDYRSLSKLKSTYLDSLPALVNPRDGFIHTSYNQAVAATGRLSSTNPNLQNIPVRTEQGREIRKAFVARDENHILMAADYSQIELRIITHLSQDPHMIDAFRHGLDIHAATAARVFGIDISQVSKEQRRVAKMVNFGIIYGISVFGLSERLEIPRSESKQIIDNYFHEYQGIKEYMNQSIELARQNGYAETMLGRRRYLRDINASNSVVRGFAERNAINAPIQGSSADMIKIAMINIHNEMRKRNMNSKMILQVHDELVFDVVLNELDALHALVEDKMVNALPLSIPIVVDINTGNNWLEAH